MMKIVCFYESQLLLLTRHSWGSNFKYFRTNSITDDIFLARSTVHFLFFIIGASPVGFSSTSTVIKAIVSEYLKPINQSSWSKANIHLPTFCVRKKNHVNSSSEGNGRGTLHKSAVKKKSFPGSNKTIWTYLQNV